MAEASSPEVTSTVGFDQTARTTFGNSSNSKKEEEDMGWDDFDEVDPLQKILDWEPKGYQSKIPTTAEEKLIPRPTKGAIERMTRPKRKSNYWRKLHKARLADPPENEAPFMKYMHFERTPTDVQLIEFLVDCLTNNSLQLQDFRTFPYSTEGVKNREIFDPEVGKMPFRKKRRLCWKLAELASLRGPQDILQMTASEWVRGHVPLPFSTIKKEMLKLYYTELSDLDRAMLWIGVAETQRHIDHQRSFSFPLKVTPIPTEDDPEDTYRAPEQDMKRYINPPPKAYLGLYGHILKKEVVEWQRDAQGR